MSLLLALNGSGGNTVGPGKGHVAFTGYVPTIAVSQIALPAMGHISLTGYIPTVAQTTNQAVAPFTGHLVATGRAPSIGQTVNVTVAPSTGHLSFVGYSPAITQDTSAVTVFPETGHAVFTGYAPTITVEGGEIPDTHDGGAQVYELTRRRAAQTAKLQKARTQEDEALSEQLRRLFMPEAPMPAPIARVAIEPVFDFDEDDEEAILALV